MLKNMKFCPNCDNMLYPKGKAFYCKICDEGFNLKTNKQEYILNKKINNEYDLMVPIIIKTPK